MAMTLALALALGAMALAVQAVDFTGNACIMLALLTEGDDPAIFRETYVRRIASILLAIDHVNNRDCSIVGGDCASLLTNNGVNVFINASMFDLHSTSPKAIPLAAVRCFENGGHYMIGPMTSAQSSLGTLLASSFDSILISSSATSPSLSDKDLYDAFARSAPSDFIFVEGVLAMVLEMGWKQVAVVHNNDLFGNGYADSFRSKALDNDLDVDRINMGAIQTDENIAEAVRQLGNTGIKIVVIVTFNENIVRFVAECIQQFGIDSVKSMVFMSGAGDVEDLISDPDTLAAIEADANLQEAFMGFLGITYLLDPVVASRLQSMQRDFRNNGFEGKLREVLLKGGASDGFLPANINAPLEDTNPLGVYSLFAYDVVWALAVGMAEAEGGSAVDGASTPGTRLLGKIREGSIPRVQGIMFEKWDENGDPELVVQLKYKQYQGQGESREFVQAADGSWSKTVGRWGSSLGVVLNETLPIVWADGSAYPSIPSDGTTTSNLIFYVILGFGLFLVLLAAAALLWRRDQRLRSNLLYGINVQQVISDAYDFAVDEGGGELASYIPELANVDPDRFAICIVTTTGKVYKHGHVDDRFTIQSASKPFMYSHLMNVHGEEYAREKINVEPSGAAFNSAELDADGRPFNPLINQGAIASMALASPNPRMDTTGLSRFKAVQNFMSVCAGRDLEMDDATYQSETRTADQNRVIVDALYKSGCIEVETDKVAGLESYMMACSLLVNVVDLASMGATLANKGKNPRTGKVVMEKDAAQSVSSVMMTCGMYNGAGNWMKEVGLPAKSGVSGALLAVVPGCCAIAVFSPRVNPHGNSVRGMLVCGKLSKDLNLHILKRGSKSSKKRLKKDGEGVITMYDESVSATASGKPPRPKPSSGAESESGSWAGTQEIKVKDVEAPPPPELEVVEVVDMTGADYNDGAPKSKNAVSPMPV